MFLFLSIFFYLFLYLYPFQIGCSCKQCIVHTLCTNQITMLFEFLNFFNVRIYFLAHDFKIIDRYNNCKVVGQFFRKEKFLRSFRFFFYFIFFIFISLFGEHQIYYVNGTYEPVLSCVCLDFQSL